MYKRQAYINRGNNNDKNDNKKIIADIVRLRLEKAQLLGFDCYSNFVLANTMAKNSTAVMDFLNNCLLYTSTLGEYEGKNVVVGAGRFGPYIQNNGLYASLPLSLIHI